MPKQKTHKASLKRFKVTAGRKVMAMPTGARHMMSGTTGNEKRHMRRARPLKGTDLKRTLKALGK